MYGAVDGHIVRSQALGPILVFAWVPQKQIPRQGFGGATSSLGSDSRKHNKEVGSGTRKREKPLESVSMIESPLRAAPQNCANGVSKLGTSLHWRSPGA